MDIPAAVLDFSLMRGGLVAHLRHRQNAPRRRTVDARVVLLPLLAWLPLLVFTAIHGPAALADFLRDVPTHAQLLLTLPGFFVAEPFVDARLALALRIFVTSHLVPAEALPRFSRDIEVLSRLRGRPLAELLLLAACFVFPWIGPLRHPAEWQVDPQDGGLTVAGAWYLWLALPIVRFHLVRWAWRMALWNVLLWRIARLRLSLVPTHPDRSGGLGFLAPCQASFALVVLAVAWSVAGAMREPPPLLAQRALILYCMPLIVLAVTALVVVFAPLGFFTPALVRTYWRGTARFAALAAWHSHLFEERWFGWRTMAQRRAENETILGSPDASSLIDLGSSFDVQRRMRLFLVDRRALLIVAGSALAPLAPLFMLHRQFLQVFGDLVGIFF